METIRIEIGNGYDVVVGEKLLESAGAFVKRLGAYRTVVVVTDDNVKKLYAETVLKSLSCEGLRAELISVKAGEGSKSLKTLETLYDFFLEKELTRTDAVVYVGGGVVGDLAGFAAATYLRGIDYIAIPTTLLAMLDSSVGGKTGVNLRAGKNLAGAFWQPKGVLIDVSTLETLDEENFRCGIGEALKYAMIRDTSILEFLKGQKDSETMKRLVAKGLAVKKYCVENDTFDTGIRQILNFGHTLGHVVEKKSDYAIPHGVAVGIGMAILTRYAEEKGWTERGTAEMIEAALRAYGMPCGFPESAEELLKEAKNDKKRKGNRLTLVLLRRAGECYLKDVEVTE